MEEITGGMRLALRHWRELAGTTLIFALVCFALSFILGDVIVEVGVLRGGATVRREGATTFACFYPPLRPVSDTNPRLLDMLSEKKIKSGTRVRLKAFFTIAHFFLSPGC